MPQYIAKVSFQYDSALPRDAVCINPVFDDKGVLTNPTNLATDLANALATWTTFTGPLSVKMYDIHDAPPAFPKGQYVKNPAATPPAAPIPRELALCLSFFADTNRPRNRGRLYMPAWWLTSAPALRPTTAQRTNVGTLVPIFANLGGADVDWCVWSRAANTVKKITNWFVDDEWDIQRSRGLRSTIQTTGTTTGRTSGIVGGETQLEEEQTMEQEEGSTEPPGEQPQG